MGMQTIDEIIDVEGKSVPFSDAQAEAEAEIKQEAGSQEIEAVFEEPQPQEEPVKDDDSWLHDKEK